MCVTNFFSVRVNEIWNSLPHKVVDGQTDETVNTFKNKYRRVKCWANQILL